VNVVLDTNVLVSGLLSPFSPGAEIVRMLVADELRLCLDARVLTEYRQVLHRPRFQFDSELVADLLDHASRTGTIVSGLPLARPLPDPDDSPFLEVALAGHAECLITGNLRHFPAALTAGVRVLSPSALLDGYRQQKRKWGQPSTFSFVLTRICR
jgi:putative PIN family toxin of toxin-antitoxin system